MCVAVFCPLSNFTTGERQPT
uniref:Uncharacterized protein n=1 Tax=Arundo donax TaxID=35708 RepID=A0A0A9CAB7_ARUDO